MKMLHLPLAMLCLASSLFADLNLFQGNAEPKISVKNAILAKVNDNTISVIDVMKKMDLLLHQNYPQFADSTQARFQFYATSWRPIFMEMIDTELMLSDAEEKEVKLTDGEIREEMENRFGPSVLVTLDKIGLSYDDAWKMVKNELIVQRMMWFFVQSKAMSMVGPQVIRQAYKNYLEENPAYQEWNYRVISVKAPADDAIRAEEVYRLFLTSNQSPESKDLILKEWESNHPDCTVQISNEYTAKDQELSVSHKAILEQLEIGAYSAPAALMSRAERKTVHRIFYLSQKSDHPAPAFETIANQLKNDLVQKSVAKQSTAYLQKLRKHYGFDPNRLQETVPDSLQPFALE